MCVPPFFSSQFSVTSGYDPLKPHLSYFTSTVISDYTWGKKWNSSGSQIRFFVVAANMFSHHKLQLHSLYMQRQISEDKGLKLASY